MVKWSRLLKALSPALAVFAATLAISVATGHPPDLFDANSTSSFVRRSLLISAILIGAVPFAPKITATLAFFMRDKTLIGRLVKTDQPRETELQRLMSWFLRPIQGIGLSMIAGESLIELLEYGTGTGYSEALARVSLFILGSLVVALLLSVVWTLDDLGLKFYFSNGDTSTAGNTVGTVLPIVSGAVGITGLFRVNTPTDAVWSIVEIAVTLYPPYLVFAVIHDEYTRGRLRRLLDSLHLKWLEARLTSSPSG